MVVYFSVAQNALAVVTNSSSAYAIASSTLLVTKSALVLLAPAISLRCFETRSLEEDNASL